jgi:hypothetical protein
LKQSCKVIEGQRQMEYRRTDWALNHESTMPPNHTARALHWSLFSPRIGFVFRADDSTVIRGGYGIFYLPNDVGFASGTYNSHVNTAQRICRLRWTEASSIRHAQHPFPTALTLPIGNDAIG